MKTISLISLALCAVCIFADDNVAEIDSTPFILVGESAKQGQFPYQVYLRKFKGTYFCDGAIISEWFVLTSAQCIRNQNLSPSNIIIVMGTVTQFGSSVKAAEISVHPKYVEKHHYNDIALLLTAEKIEFSPKIQPIKLPTFDWMGHGAHVTISGFDVGGNGALQLKYAHTKVLGLPICGLKHGRFIFNTNLCTKSKKMWAADEGGPLVHEGRKGKTLVGIVSSYNWGSDKPNIYTRVFSYRKWIKAEMYRLLSKPTSHPDVPDSTEPNYPASSLKSN